MNERTFLVDGKKIKRFQKSLGLSQEKLSAMCPGVSTRTLTRIVAGNHRVYWSTLVAIAHALEVGMESLVAGESAKPSVQVFSQSDDQQTHEALSKSMRVCREAKMCALGLNFLWRESSLQLLRERVVNNQMVAQICMANFKDELIKHHLNKESRSKTGEGTSEELIGKLIDLENQVGDEARFSVKLFNHDPMYAMLLFDKNVYLYFYGFGTLGNYSPAFSIEKIQKVFSFFNNQFAFIWENAVHARDLY